MKTRISIATGGTGGIHYPLGGGMAELISKHIPNTEATNVVGLGDLAAGLSGWLLTKKTLIERIVLIAAGLVLIYPSVIQDVIGIGLLGFAGLLQYRRRSDAAV